MSALTVGLALQALLQQADGIDPDSVLLGEPTALHDPPALLIVYGTFERTLRSTPPAQNLVNGKHTFAIRLVVQWFDNAEAERELLNLVEVVPDAIDADSKLGGIVNYAKITSALTGFPVIGGTTYRALDYTVEVQEKPRIT